MNSLFVGFRLLSGGAEPVSEFVDFASEFGELGCRQSQSLLVLLDLSAECPDFVGALLSQSVQTFALLRKDFHFVLAFRVESLESSFVVRDSFLEFIIFATNDFEFVLKFAESSCRKA